MRALDLGEPKLRSAAPPSSAARRAVRRPLELAAHPVAIPVEVEGVRIIDTSDIESAVLHDRFLLVHRHEPAAEDEGSYHHARSVAARSDRPSALDRPWPAPAVDPSFRPLARTAAGAGCP